MSLYSLADSADSINVDVKPAFFAEETRLEGDSKSSCAPQISLEIKSGHDQSAEPLFVWE